MLMKFFHIFMFVLCIFFFSFIALSQNSIPVITYFPPNDEIGFTNATNVLQYTNNTISWNVSSSTTDKTYLRQDVSLLYKDGIFIGYMNIWKNPGQHLHMHKDFPQPQSGLYESISIHYSEFHLEKEIFSSAAMDGDFLQLACKNQGCSEMDLENPSFIYEISPIQTHWNELMTFFNVEKDAYNQIALSQLKQYAHSPLPSFTQKETDAIILRLWEGLYANYVVNIMETEKEKRAHYMPLVLFNTNEIRIFYEINGNKEELIQRIPS